MEAGGHDEPTSGDPALDARRQNKKRAAKGLVGVRGSLRSACAKTATFESNAHRPTLGARSAAALAPLDQSRDRATDFRAKFRLPSHDQTAIGLHV